MHVGGGEWGKEWGGRIACDVVDISPDAHIT